MDFNISLDTFEGPLDLLLYLIKKNDMDIYDIHISRITQAYLDYIDMMRSFNIDVAGEFIVMAATLIQIKSRTLLPSPESSDNEEAEDPRSELVQRLIEYRKIKEAALALREKEEQQREVFTRESMILTDEDYVINVTLFDLIDAFQTIVTKAPGEIREIIKEEISIDEKIRFIMDQLEKQEFITFRALFSSYTKMETIVTLLALLELIRVHYVAARQSRMFGEIRLYRGESFNHDVIPTSTAERTG